MTKYEKYHPYWQKSYVIYQSKSFTFGYLHDQWGYIQCILKEVLNKIMFFITSIQRNVESKNSSYMLLQILIITNHSWGTLINLKQSKCATNIYNIQCIKKKKNHETPIHYMILYSVTNYQLKCDKGAFVLNHFKLVCNQFDIPIL